MRALWVKEIRLLLPVYWVALVLGIIPIWLVPRTNWAPTDVTLYPLGLAMALLALSTFGREFGLATFPLLMAQPLERTRIWRAKLAVLAGAVGTVLGGYGISCLVWSSFGDVPKNNVTGLVFLGTCIAVVFVAGGLWSTLLLRQVAAAFWFTVFVPAGIVMLVFAIGGGPAWAFGILTIYSAVGLAFAWRLFRGAQEVMWTGGAVTVSGWIAGAARGISDRRSERPIWALVRNELHLQQVTLLGMVGLLVVHVLAVFTRKIGVGQAEGNWREILDWLNFWPFLWLFAPLLAGSLSIAEERRLGTMEAHLNLPVSRGAQFLIKLMSVMLIGGGLSWVMMGSAEGLAFVLGVPAQIGIFSVRETWLALLGAMVFLPLLAFYASSLTRNVLQAMGVAVVLALLLFSFYRVLHARYGGIWEPSLYDFFSWPAILVVCLVMAHHNFRQPAGDGVLWTRNVLVVGTTWLASVGVATGVTTRAWELVMPLEPQHGQAGWSPENAPDLRHCWGGRELALVLPDGRLRVEGLQTDPDRIMPGGVRLHGDWVWFAATNHIPAGSNWVEALAIHGLVVGIQKDGTLWVSEDVIPPADAGAPAARMAQVPKWVRFGVQADWKSIVKRHGEGVLLLKRDGSFWQWGTNVYGNTQHRLAAYEPIRIGNDSDWKTMLPTLNATYGWKTNGEAWIIRGARSGSIGGSMEMEAGLFRERYQPLDGTQWRSIASTMNYYVGAREDGTVWAWKETPEAGSTDRFGMGLPERIDEGVSLFRETGFYDRMAVVKVDGSLWSWRIDYRYSGERLKFHKKRLSVHRDWVSASGFAGGIISVAADGSLWHWRMIPEHPNEWLGLSRRPTALGNLCP
jgi:hypothetical protein